MIAVQEVIKSVPLLKDEFEKYYMPKTLSVSNQQQNMLKGDSSNRILLPREATSMANDETSYYETSSRYSKISK
jgi:hypothetical protein